MSFIARTLLITLTLSLAAACSDDSGGDASGTDTADTGAGATTADSGAPDTSGAADTGAADSGGDEDTGGGMTDVSPDTVDGGGELVEIGAVEGCDPLDPGYCALPWPSSYYLTEDASTPTGLKVSFGPESLPRGGSGPIDPTYYNMADGFALYLHAIFLAPGLDLEGLPRLDDFASIDRTRTAESPTLLIRADTGELVPHIVERDERGWQDQQEDPTAQVPIYLRGLSALEPGTRYIVALRGLRDEEGALLEPSPAFRALRDGLTSDSPELEARREAFEGIFSAVEAQGVDRGELYLAWDFTTGSDAYRHRVLLDMREQAFAAAEEAGFSPQITDCEASPAAKALLDDPSVCPGDRDDGDPIAVQLEGTIEFPLFTVNDAGAPDDQPGAILARDDDGLAVLQEGATFTADFLIRVPQAALDGAGGTGAMLYSHGQLGSRYEGLIGYFGGLAQVTNVVLGGVDMHGMSGPDQLPLTEALADMSRWGRIVDRQHQGLINNALMGRFMVTEMTTHPLFVDLGITVDEERAFYYGASQGGIFGPSITSLWPDAKCGVFGVPGVSYPVMLQRSVNYAAFEQLLDFNYPTAIDQAVLLSAVGLVWEKTEGAGFAHRLIRDPLPGEQPKRALLLMSLADYQVPNFATALMARSLGVPLMEPFNVPIWGLEAQPYPHTGSALIDFDFGNNPPPVVNLPPDPETDPEPDPHSRLEDAEGLINALPDWLDTGALPAFCEGPCDPN